MSENSKIEWTDHTFNGWWGCTKVHEGCRSCYAESWDTRWGGDHWGPRNPRRMIIGEWSKPFLWNREAIDRFGRRARVFCSSMSDIFEDYLGSVVDQRGNLVEVPKKLRGRYGNHDHWHLPMLRRRILEMIEETPNLEWLLLTKRPENAVSMVPAHWSRRWPDNVMIGTSPCNQKTAETCIPALLTVPARRFLSYEPALGELDLRHHLHHPPCPEHPSNGTKMASYGCMGCLDRIHWVIGGGESGARARSCNVDWLEQIVHQCLAGRVPCFIKQLGDRPVRYARETGRTDYGGPRPVEAYPIKSPKGQDMAEWPAVLRVREFPAMVKAA